MVHLAPLPLPSWRMFHVVMRNFLVWKKLIFPSLAGLLIDPAVALFGIGLGVGSLVGEVGELPYIVFVASGMAGYSIVMTASFEALYSAFSRMHIQKTWESLRCSPLLLGDIFLGELLWAMVKSMFSSLALLAIVVGLGFLPWYGALLVLPALVLGGLAIAAFALCFNAVANSYDFFSYYFSLFLTPMTMLSGLFFPREILPMPIYLLSELLPLTQIIKLVRPLAQGQMPEQILLPVVYLVICICVFTFIAYQLTYRRIVK